MITSKKATISKTDPLPIPLIIGIAIAFGIAMRVLTLNL